MKPPRGLSREEAALWARIAATVKPLEGREGSALRVKGDQANAGAGARAVSAKADPERQNKPPEALNRPAPLDAAPRRESKPPPRSLDHQGLDSSWDRRLARGLVAPDFTLDLHGHTLDSAHARLDRGLAQAKALGARLVLVVTGRPRPADAADRGQRRGAIRAKILDWLAVGEHAHDIAAVRGAHRRHGGVGALYVVLKRRR